MKWYPIITQVFKMKKVFSTGMNAKAENTLKSNPMFSLKEKSGANSEEILPQIIGLLKKNIPPREECQLLNFFTFSGMLSSLHTPSLTLFV